MPTEHLHHPAGPLQAAVLLAAAAGAVDAHVFLHVTPVFVANMSGNLVHLGMATGEGDWSEAVGSGLALTSFAAGVMLAMAHLDRRRRRGVELLPTALFAVEAFLLVAVATGLWWTGVDYADHLSWVAALVVAVSSFAMGVQAASLRNVGQVAVATTYGTGAVVRIAEKSVLAVRRAERAVEHRRRRSVIVLCAVVAAYVCGAAVAARAGTGLILLAAAVLVGVSLVLVRRSSSTARVGP